MYTEWSLIVVSISISLVTNVGEDLSMDLLNLASLLLQSVCSNLLPTHYWTSFIVHLLIVELSVLYVFWIHILPISDISIVGIFSPSPWLTFLF